MVTFFFQCLIALVKVIGIQEIRYINVQFGWGDFYINEGLSGPRHKRTQKQLYIVIHIIFFIQMNTTVQSKEDSLSRKNQQILIHANSAEYSITLGCAPDVCHVEQATMISTFCNPSLG